MANQAFYDSENARNYLSLAPHMKHPALRNLYGELVVEVYDAAAEHGVPRILDIGAGEGSAVLPWLQLGGEVTAVDISPDMMEALRRRCVEYGPKLETTCADICDALESLRNQGRQYDIATANSFLHHFPDYLGLIREVVPLLSGHGQFFSFQDPLWFDSIEWTTKAFSRLAHYSWRVFQPNVADGFRRYMRRRRNPDPDNPEDNAEYHYFRNGVDQDAIRALFEAMGFSCRIVRYFSTQSGLWQRVGDALGLECAFAVIARRNDDLRFPVI